MELIKTLCAAFIERSDALGLKGKKRDDAAMHYFVGAAKALDLAGQDTKRLISWVGFVLQYRGYNGVVEEVKNA